MRRSSWIVVLLMALEFGTAGAQPGSYTAEEAVAVAKKQNPEILLAAKQLEAARGGVVEARAGFLPGVVSTGLHRQRQRADPSRLRPEDYNASVRVVHHLYPGGAVPSQ